MGTPVYIDFDDVLCETALAFTGLLEREFGKRVAFEEIHSFNLGHSFGLDDAQLAHLMEAGHQPAFLNALTPVPGALEGLRRWADAGVEIHIVTGRPASTAPACSAWLRAHAVPAARLVFVDKYGRHLLPGGTDPTLTLDALVQLEFALAVEDAPRMADYLARHTRWPLAVIERPWNRHATIGDNSARVSRCRDWSAILVQFPAPGVTR